MAAIAVSLRLDPFPKVKKAIDDMVAQLLKEKEDDIKECNAIHIEVVC